MSVHEAETGQKGLVEAATRKPDLVIVDLGLPDTDGIDMIRELRGWTELPIIVLSARTQEEQKVAAIDAGADDYLTKPFGVSELMARIRAHLRRRNQAASSETPIVTFGDVTVDLALRRVTRNGDNVHLTPIEYRLLSTLVRYAGRVLVGCMGAIARRKPALLAHLHGAFAAKARARCRAAGTYRDGNGRGVSVGWGGVITPPHSPMPHHARDAARAALPSARESCPCTDKPPALYRA